MNDQKPVASERPQVAEGKVPLWIKVMWALGISWVLIYAYQGLHSTPINW